MLRCAFELARADLTGVGLGLNPFIHANAPVVVPVGADRRSAWRARSKVAGRVCSEPLFPEALLIDETVLVAARP